MFLAYIIFFPFWILKISLAIVVTLLIIVCGCIGEVFGESASWATEGTSGVWEWAIKYIDI